MKHILFSLTLLAGLVSLTACSSDDATFTPTAPLSINTADITFESDGGTGTITVNTSSPLTATVKTGTSWASTAVNGNVVTVTALRNNTLSGRSATIVLEAGGAKAEVTATQKGFIYGLPEGLEYSCSDNAGTLTIDVNNSYGVSVESLNSDWLTATYDADNQQVIVSVASNDDRTARQGSVAIETAGIRDTLVISQDPLVLETLTENPCFATNAAARDTIEISHSKPVEIESLNDWLTATLSRDGNLIYLRATANTTGAPRLGYVRVASGNVADTLQVTQYDFDTDILGSYTFYFSKSASTPDWSSLNATLTADALVLDIMGQLQFTIPVSYPNGKKLPVAIEIADEQYVGDYTPYYCYLGFDNAGVDFLTRYPDYFFGALTGTTAYTELEMGTYSDGTVGILGAFGGDLYLGGDLLGNVITWHIIAMNSKNYAKSAFVADLLTMHYPQIEKASAGASTSPRLTAKKFTLGK